MAKRFTDSDKWIKKPWFRSLKPSQKLFWLYLLDVCDQCGVWEVDFGLAELLIGEKLDESDIRAVFRKQYTELAGGRKWFIQDFIDFQYGELKDTNRMHSFVSKLLVKQGVSIPLKQHAEGAKDKDKEEEIKGVQGDFLKFGEMGLVLLTPEEHEKLLVKLGERRTAEYITRLENYIGSKGKKYKSHYHTILSWTLNEKTVETTTAKVKRENKPKPGCEACGGTGKLPDGPKCWCW